MEAKTVKTNKRMKSGQTKNGSKVPNRVTTLNPFKSGLEWTYGITPEEANTGVLGFSRGVTYSQYLLACCQHINRCPQPILGHHLILVVYLTHIFQVISRDIALPFHFNVKLLDFFMFFMRQFEVDIWMIYTFKSNAMRFPFNFVKLLKSSEFSIQSSQADPFLSSSKSQAIWFHFQWPSSWKVQCIIWTI